MSMPPSAVGGRGQFERKKIYSTTMVDIKKKSENIWLNAPKSHFW